jgi:short-subunit dehydrogenase
MHQDVRDPESHRQVARAARERGPLALWVNNAGVLSSAKVWDMDDDDIRRHIDVNLLGVIWGSRAAVDAMDTGHIINIASMSALLPTPGLAVYGATKHAVLGFSLGLQGDLRNAGRAIHVSTVCPDCIDTDMVRQVADCDTAALLFSASKMLRAEEVADKVAALVDAPRLVAIIPRHRGVLTHLFRPFPGMSLRVLDLIRWLGERRQRQHQ